MKLERALVIARDLLCLAIGAGGIIHQEVTGVIHEALLAVYTGFLMGPGIAALVPRLRNGGTVTPEQSESSQRRQVSEESPRL